MDWLTRHRYTATLVFAGTVMLVGTVIVTSRSSIAPNGPKNTWGSNLPVSVNTVSPELPHQNPPALPTLSGNDYRYVSPFSSSTGSSIATPPAQNDVLDWTSFQATLAKGPATQVSEITQETSVLDSYSFIPSGLFTPTSPTTSRSPEDQALYNYGNEVGKSIRWYEQDHPNQTATLTDFDQDRNNPVKIEAMKRLGADLSSVGDAIDDVSTTPPEIGKAGANLANAYREIGAKLAAIPDGKSNKALVEAILIYNSSAERFARTYVSLALIFQANGITFDQNEAGSVFMFPNSSIGS